MEWPIFYGKDVLLLAIIPPGLYVLYLGTKALFTKKIIYIGWNTWSLTERNYRVARQAKGFRAVLIGIFYIIIVLFLFNYIINHFYALQ